MTVIKVTHNSKKTFFGGGMGSLIPLSGNMTPPSQRNSESVAPSLPPEFALEVKEQMGLPIEATEKSDSSTGQGKKTSGSWTLPSMAKD